MKRPLLLGWVFLLGTAVPALADGPAQLLEDVAPGSIAAPQGAYGFARIGDRAVFLSPDNDFLPALWVTDGTASGTVPLAVLCPPCGYGELLGSTGSLAFYRVTGQNVEIEMQIWRTDGTREGTFPVTESFTRFPQTPLSSLAGNRLFFIACTQQQGCEPWSTDGTLAGTGLVGETARGPANGRALALAATGDRAFLIVEGPGGRMFLWHADGLGRSLVRLQRTSPARHLRVADGRAFFTAEGSGFVVWTSDGTPAGTRLVTRFRPQAPLNHFLRILDGRLFLTVDDGVHGYELWSVGARAGTQRRLTNFPNRDAFSFGLEKAGSRIVFAAYEGWEDPKLWSSQGTFASTAMLAGCPGGCPAVTNGLAALGNGRIVFVGDDRGGEGFWVSDGTGPGTRLLKRSNGWHGLVQMNAAGGGRALFELTNEYETGDLWITDGTRAGTFFVTQGGPSWSHYYGWGGSLQAVAVNQLLLFPGHVGDDRFGVPWRSDGLPAGSRPLLEAPLGNSSYPRSLVPFRDGLLVQDCVGTERALRFVRGGETRRLVTATFDYCENLGLTPVVLGDVALLISYGPDGYKLRRTDGTAAGTAVVDPTAGLFEPVTVTRFGDQAAVWYVRNGLGGFESQLWLTDGTPGGARKVFERPFFEMFNLTGIGDKLYFFELEQQGEDFAWRPWVSDGTGPGTRPLTGGGSLAEIRSVPSNDPAFIELGNRVFFLAFAGGGPLEVWTTDGTPAGTRPAITAASGILEPERLVALDGRLYFAARRKDDPSGRLLPWVSDGTDGGTAMLADVTLRDETFALQGRRPFAELAGRVFFAASDAAHGDELWVTDGTPEGTALVRDGVPGPRGSYPRNLATWRDRLYFSARDAVHGMELWTTDGTAQGTRLVQDIAAGASWSTPANLTATEEALYFSAHDGAHGRELWVLAVEP